MKYTQLYQLGEVTIDERQQAARFLRGSGIEIGAGHMPIQLDRGCCKVRYVDILSDSEIKLRFPKLEGQNIVSVDVTCDVAREGLALFANESQDFIIACHLLEHLPNPLEFLKECHRVLRNFGILFLAIPDKDYTFDKDRKRTSITHLIKDLKNNTTTVDEEHLIDYLVNAAKKAIPDHPEEKNRIFQRELDRSIHVHVWTWMDIVDLLRYMLINERVTWELCEAYLPKEVKNEAIFLLRKTKIAPKLAIKHFNSSLEAITAREKALEGLVRTKLSVVVVTYNNRATIEKCLVSIFNNPPKFPFEVLISDNASTDGTLEAVKQYTQIEFISNKKNIGFAKANNRALEKARGDLILLLNPDAILSAGSLQNMMEFMKKNEIFGILGPKLLNDDGSIQKENSPFPKLFDSILVLLKLHRLKPFSRFVYPHYDYEKIQEADHLMGSALLVRKEVFSKIGLFDEEFFLWFEETDFEKRAKEAGFKLVYYPKVVVKHLVGQSTKQLNPLKRQAIWNKSLLHYFDKHKSKIELSILIPFIMLSYIPALLLLVRKVYSNR